MATDNINTNESGNTVDETVEVVANTVNSIKPYKITMARLSRKTAENRLKCDTLFITFDKTFPRMQQDKVTGLWTEIQTNEYSIARFTMERQIEQISEPAAIFVACHDDGKLNAAELAKILIGSTVGLQSTLRKAGEIVNGEPLDRDSWYNNIVSIQLCDRAKQFVENFDF